MRSAIASDAIPLRHQRFSPMTIPVVLMEEHHEAFLVWEVARQKGWLPTEGSFLLHVDAHSDLSLPVLSTSLGGLPHVALDHEFGDLLRVARAVWEKRA